MSPETPYFGPAYEYEIDPKFRPSYLNLERDVPSLPVEPGIVVQPVLGNRMNISFIYFAPHTVAPVHQHREEQIGTVLESRIDPPLGGRPTGPRRAARARRPCPPAAGPASAGRLLPPRSRL
jgi:hypothetical protein